MMEGDLVLGEEEMAGDTVPYMTVLTSYLEASKCYLFLVICWEIELMLIQTLCVWLLRDLLIVLSLSP